MLVDYKWESDGNENGQSFQPTLEDLHGYYPKGKEPKEEEENKKEEKEQEKENGESNYHNVDGLSTRSPVEAEIMIVTESANDLSDDGSQRNVSSLVKTHSRSFLLFPLVPYPWKFVRTIEWEED